MPCNGGSSDIIDISVPNVRYCSTKLLHFSKRYTWACRLGGCECRQFVSAEILLLYCCFTAALLGHTCTHRRHSSRGTFSGTGARQSVSIVIRTFVPLKQVSICTFEPVKQVNCAPGGSARRIRCQQTESACLPLGAASTASARYTGAASITPAAAAAASVFAP